MPSSRARSSSWKGPGAPSPCAPVVGVFPDAASNGVYLRSDLAKRGSDAYKMIPSQSGRQRDWHGFTQNSYLGGYYIELEKSLVSRGAVDPRLGVCLKGQAGYDDALDAVKRAMLRGGYLYPGQPEQ